MTWAIENVKLKLVDDVTDAGVGVKENTRESLLTPGSLENAGQQSFQRKATD